MFGTQAHRIRHTHLFSAATYECSACGQEISKNDARCPRCGSTLQGEDYDPSWVEEAAMLDMILGDK
ncbi:MAG: hypothetical protein IKN72_12430 [Clostridia bacterium]|nr:hypothetical protein [Clostridia bacterium]